MTTDPNLPPIRMGNIFNSLLSLLAIGAIAALIASLSGCTALRDASRCQPGRAVPIHPGNPAAGYYIYPAVCP